MYKFVKNTTHPKGGYQVIRTKKANGKSYKSEGHVWLEDYPNKKSVEQALKELEVTLTKEVNEKAEKAQKKDLFEKNTAPQHTLRTIAEDRIDTEGDASMGTYFRTVISRWGDTLPADFNTMYSIAIKELTTEEKRYGSGKRTTATINRFVAVFRMIFKHAIFLGVIKEGDLKIKFKTSKEKGRDIIWTPEQREKAFKWLEDTNSWIRWHVYFAAFNPIRAGDLFGDPKRDNPGLQRSNWKAHKNWVEFMAHKTTESESVSDITDRPTYLKQIDSKLREYFDSLPESCNQLFPRKWPDGTYTQFDDYRWEWDKMCEACDLKGFRFHDLKHCAITFLLDNGYSERDLKQLGIQYSQKMIDRYYHFHADKAPVIAGFEKPETPVLKIYEKEEVA